MSSKIVNLLGLLIVAGIVSVLAINPKLVGSFFDGASKLLGVALAGGRR